MSRKSFISGHIVPYRVSGQGYKIIPVCVCDCLPVSALTVELFELRT